MPPSPTTFNLLTQKEKSLIERLPAGRRDEFLRKLSANASGPGGRPPKSLTGWTLARAGNDRWRKHAANLGVVAIEQAPLAALTSNVWAPPPLAQRANMILDAPGSTPATLTFTTDVPQVATYAGAGAKTLAVTAAMQAAGYEGKAAFTQ